MVSKGRDKEAINIETLTHLVMTLTTELFKLKQCKTDTFSSSHPDPGRDRQATRQAATGLLQKLHKSVCSSSSSVGILSSILSMKNIILRTLVRTGSGSQILSTVIHSMCEAICKSSRKTLTMINGLHLMIYQALGMW